MSSSKSLPYQNDEYSSDTSSFSETAFCDFKAVMKKGIEVSVPSATGEAKDFFIACEQEKLIFGMRRNGKKIKSHYPCKSVLSIQHGVPAEAKSTVKHIRNTGSRAFHIVFKPTDGTSSHSVDGKTGVFLLPSQMERDYLVKGLKQIISEAIGVNTAGSSDLSSTGLTDGSGSEYSGPSVGIIMTRAHEVSEAQNSVENSISEHSSKLRPDAEIIQQKVSEIIVTETQDSPNDTSSNSCSFPSHPLFSDAGASSGPAFINGGALVSSDYASLTMEERFELMMSRAAPVLIFVSTSDFRKFYFTLNKVGDIVLGSSKDKVTNEVIPVTSLSFSRFGNI